MRYERRESRFGTRWKPDLEAARSRSRIPTAIRSSFSNRRVENRGAVHSPSASPFEATASFKVRLGEKDLHMSKQLVLILVRQTAKDSDVAFEDRPPLRRHRFKRS